MLNRKRIAAVIAATALTVAVQSVAGLALSGENTYQNIILKNILEMNAAQASAEELNNTSIIEDETSKAETSKAETSKAETSKTETNKTETNKAETNVTAINSVGIGVPYADDDPGRERLSGEAILPELEEGSVDIQTMMNMRSIAGYSPFMGNTPYFHSDVFTGRKIVHGIDVSKYQKDIDWQAVTDAGVEYAIIRVGFRGYGASGGMGADSYFEQNIKGAIAAGIDVGVYFFSQATTEKEAIEEAEYTLNKIKGYDITLPVVMDFEYATVNGREGGRLYDAGLSKEEATNVCLAFCKTVEKAGYEPMVYANATMLKNKMNASEISNKYKIWLANYTSMTAYTGEYDFWQYSSKGAVNGIAGNVDCNFWYQEADGGSTEAPEQNPGETPEVTPEQKPGETPEELPTITAPVVSGLSVADRTASTIQLNWDKAENVTGYRIFRYDSTIGKYKKIGVLKDNNLTAWTDTDLEAGETYQYVIRSYIKTANGTYRSPKNTPAVAETRPDVVSGFSAAATQKTEIKLSWQQTKGADGYRIFRYNTATNSYERIKTIKNGSKTTWTNSGLESSTVYKYKIKAFAETAEGIRYAGAAGNVITVKTN